MQEDFEQFCDRNARIVVIAPHRPENVKNYWEKETLSFDGVPDPEGKFGKRYGQEWKLFKLGRLPALFIVDRKGKIAFAQYGKDMADIPSNTHIFSMLDDLNNVSQTCVDLSNLKGQINEQVMTSRLSFP
jgi:peroxiredoxin Q/BCP